MHNHIRSIVLHYWVERKNALKGKGLSFLLLIGLLLPAHVSRAQSSVSVDSLLEQISAQQVKETNFFYKGSFPSYRLYGAGHKLKQDNNIFFTGLIAFTLKKLKPYLNTNQQKLCDSIIHRAQEAFPYFENKKGLPTYNFWRTRPPLVFPNSWLLSRFSKKQALPDDLDDTVILWLSQNPSDSILLLVKRLMGEHANGKFKQVKNTFPQFRELPAYSTWFGVNMPVDFDFCVLCNVLYFVYHYNLSLNVHDSASISLLRQMITTGYYKTDPAYISPHYGRSPVLLYHIARLLGEFSVSGLDSLRPQLIQTAEQEFQASDNWLDSVLLSTALMRLGEESQPIRPPDHDNLFATKETFFVAGLTSMLSSFWKKLFLNSEWVEYYFLCPAYRQTLYLENVILTAQQ